ncbi:MAG: S9 family peptidase [Rubrivivax sp.]
MNITPAATLALALSAAPAIAQTPPQAPSAPAHEHVSNWHGEKVDDPYFWLREKDSPPVIDYLKAENAYTETMTQGLAPMTDTLYKEMLGRIQQTDLDVPVRRGNWYYYSRTVKGLQYPIRCRRPATATLAYDAQAREEVLIDLNAMAKGKAFIDLGDMKVSDDAGSLLYTIDDTGYRQYQLFRKNLTTGQVEGPLAERVTSVEWAADNETVFYITEDPTTKRSDSLWRLASGGAPERLLIENDALFRIELSRTRDRRYLVLQNQSTDTWESRLLDARQPGGTFAVVLPREKGHKYEVDEREGLLYIRTNRDAKDFRIVTAPLADPSPANWKPFVDHRPGVLVEGLEVFKSFIVVSEKSEGLLRLRIQNVATGTWRQLPFNDPVYAAAIGPTPDYDSSTFRYTYQSLVTPPSVYDVALATGKATLRKRQAVLGGYDPRRYVSQRLWLTARDGTRVPLSLVYRKDRPRDGKGALLLYAYGSYGFGTPATFRSGRLSLLDRGVAFAIAHIRGGDEMGEAWHDDGMLLKKKNTFYDFIDSAEYLVNEGWVAKDRLAIQGGSAGGLLMGAVTNLRPELFKAVHAAVPFVDVMNTMMDKSLPLTVGEYLEWGNPNEKAAFDYMRSYSPYDNLQKKAYPAILVTTSYNDSQVMYWEPAKYVAKLRTLKTDTHPLLLKIKMDPAGHGGASGRYDALKDRAFELAWMLQQVGITQ